MDRYCILNMVITQSLWHFITLALQFPWLQSQPSVVDTEIEKSFEIILCGIGGSDL